MDLSSDNARYEVKGVTAFHGLPQVEEWIWTHSVGFHPEYPQRQVNNIYFDDHDLGCWQTNVAGVTPRNKVRMRWFGEAKLPTAGQLEIKYKQNNLGWKFRYQAPGLRLESLTWLDAVSEIKKAVPEEGRMWLDSTPNPILINRYQRRYFVSADARIRITLDCDLSFFDQTRDPSPNLDRASPSEDVLVLELKFSPCYRAMASEVLRDIPVRVSRFSKYVVGVAAACV